MYDRINACWWTLKGQQPIIPKMALPRLIATTQFLQGYDQRRIKNKQ